MEKYSAMATNAFSPPDNREIVFKVFPGGYAQWTEPVVAPLGEARPDDEREYVELVRMEPDEWNRRANTVIAYLDRITVWDRVKKDDVSVMRQMERFTLAQITEMIGLAQEANAVNVLAALLEYKNANFADFDPMEEFTLEW